MSEPATKSDLRAVRTDFEQLRGEVGELRGEVGDLRGEVRDLRTDFERSQASNQQEFRELRGLFASLQAGQVRIIEAMHDMEARIRGDFEARFARVEVRLDMVEQALRETSEQVAENRRAIDKVQADVSTLRVEFNRLTALAEKLAHRSRRDDDRLDVLEVRVSALEARLPREE